MEAMNKGLGDIVRFIRLEKGARFLIYCNTCRRPLMQSKVDPDTHPILHRVAQSSSFGHNEAYVSRHTIEKIDLQTGKSTVISG